MKITMLDSNTLGKGIDFVSLEELGELTVYESTAPEQVQERIADCDVLIINKIKLGTHNLPAAKKLRLICVTATGYDNIDTKYCKENSIAVANVVGYSTDSVAQLSVALVLQLILHLGSYIEYTRSGEYTKSGVANHLVPEFSELCGKTWGVVGLGAIGKRVAKIAEAFGCRVICHKRTPEEGFTVVPLDVLMSQSDIITVHLPLSKDTAGIISREMLAKMKKTAIIVNVARGAVIDEEALCDAVERGEIGGAATDVYAAEPLGAQHCYNRIKDRENFIMTPHMAWGAIEARRRCIAEIAENIAAFMRGERRNRVE